MTIDAALAREALGRMEEAIETHLRQEEADLLPLIPDPFTAGDFAFFRAESARTNPPQAFLPWLLDDAPDADLAFFTGPMPAPDPGAAGIDLAASTAHAGRRPGTHGIGCDGSLKRTSDLEEIGRGGESGFRRERSRRRRGRRR